MVLYRKYRPQTISELDSARVRDRLSDILSSGRIPHAFLFTGPKGTGKTSSARIVAKILNCEKIIIQATSSKLPATLEPCNSCESCTSITNGTNLDILEIDAASNRGIDEIRSLREKVKLAPMQAKNKVYIIDEVHMLTTEAFNALLKTIEEPPKHTYFILATTEAHKLPDTITSRCSLVQFYKASDDEIVHALKRVVQGEKIEASDDVLLILARAADGAFRDGVKLLDEAAGSRKKLSREDAETVAGTNQSIVDECIALLKKRDAKSLLSFISSLSDKGISHKTFQKDLLNKLHSQLLAHFGIAGYEDAGPFTPTEIEELITIVTKALAAFKNSPIEALALEITVIRWCEEPHKSVGVVPRGDPKSTSHSDLNTLGTLSDLSILSPSKTPDNSLKTQLINAVKIHNQSIAALLRSSKELTREGDTIIIVLSYEFHYDRLRDEKSLAILTKAAQELFGTEITIKPILLKK